MYPSLLKKCLLDIIYEPQELFTDKTVNQHSIVEGTYYPKRAHTMIGMKRLQNIPDNLNCRNHWGLMFKC